MTAPAATDGKFRVEVRAGNGRWLLCRFRDRFDAFRPPYDGRFDDFGAARSHAERFALGKSPEDKVRIVAPDGCVLAVLRRRPGGKVVDLLDVMGCSPEDLR